MDEMNKMDSRTERDYKLDAGLFDDLREYFEQRSDVKDGSYGVPHANEEMNLLSRLNDCVLAALAEPAPNARKQVRNVCCGLVPDGKALCGDCPKLRRDTDGPIDPDARRFATSTPEEAPSEVCCGDFAKCRRPCTPRGIELGKQIEEDRQRYMRDEYVALRAKSCPECGNAESYYWLKSSGRCEGCGFHWGKN